MMMMNTLLADIFSNPRVWVEWFNNIRVVQLDSARRRESLRRFCVSNCRRRLAARRIALTSSAVSTANVPHGTRWINRCAKLICWTQVVNKEVDKAKSAVLYRIKANQMDKNCAKADKRGRRE